MTEPHIVINEWRRWVSDLYRCFDGTGRVVYVGQTIDIGHRFANHRNRSWWWPSVVRVEVDPGCGYEESAEIARLRPKHNRTDNPDWTFADQRWMPCMRPLRLERWEQPSKDYRVLREMLSWRVRDEAIQNGAVA